MELSQILMLVDAVFGLALPIALCIFLYRFFKLVKMQKEVNALSAEFSNKVTNYIIESATKVVLTRQALQEQHEVIVAIIGVISMQQKKLVSAGIIDDEPEFRELQDTLDELRGANRKKEMVKIHKEIKDEIDEIIDSGSPPQP